MSNPVPQREPEIRQSVLRGGVSEGVEVVCLDNGLCQIDVLPTRGMGIWKATGNGVPVGWNSPVARPVHPQFVDLRSRNGLGWLDGFNELLCRCGLAFNGPPGKDERAASPIESEVTLHGRIANLPAADVRFGRVTVDGSSYLEVTGVVEEATMFGPRLALKSTVRLAERAMEFSVIDQITNHGASPAEWELLYHWNIGRPFLGENSTFSAPIKEVAPRDSRAAEGIESFSRYLGPTAGYCEQVYYFDLAGDAADETTVLLANAAGDRGLSQRFSVRELPCFSLWKCTQPEAAGYVTGLEPGVNFPNFKAYERQQGRVRILAPGATATVTTQIGIHLDAASVRTVREQIKKLSPAGPIIHRQPRAGWSA